MGTIKTTNIEPIADNGTVTLGSSGDQFTLATGAKSSFLYPAFEAYLSADQGSNADDTYVKAQIDTEIFDTDNCYDNTTNYRFTPTVAGKYFVYGSSKIQCDTSLTMAVMRLLIYKNGSLWKQSTFDPADNQANSLSLDVNGILDMNGTTDYVELYGQMNTTGSGNTWRFDADIKGTYFGAYRIGS